MEGPYTDFPYLREKAYSARNKNGDMTYEKILRYHDI